MVTETNTFIYSRHYPTPQSHQYPVLFALLPLFYHWRIPLHHLPLHPRFRSHPLPHLLTCLFIFVLQLVIGQQWNTITATVSTANTTTKWCRWWSKLHTFASSLIGITSGFLTSTLIQCNVHNIFKFGSILFFVPYWYKDFLITNILNFPTMIFEFERIWECHCCIIDIIQCMRASKRMKFYSL